MRLLFSRRSVSGEADNLRTSMRTLVLPLLLAIAGLANAQNLPARGLIVQLKPSIQGEREQPFALRERLKVVARDSGVSSQGEASLGRRHMVLRFPGLLRGQALDDAARRLRLHPEVVSVEPDVLMRRLDTTPADPGYSLQWHLQSPAIHASALNLPAAWDITTGTVASVVAVLDTGVRPGHPDLAGRLLAGYDFVSEVEFANDGNGRDSDASDPGDWVTSAEASGPIFRFCEVSDSSWHGTFIAGQIAAATGNGQGIAGVNWAGKILPVRVSGKCGAFLSDILDGIRWAAGLTVSGVPDNANPAKVINLSFGGDAPCGSSYQSVIDEITARGSLLVVAAGNESGAPSRPADCRRVLTVGAAQSNGAKASYSNLGGAVSLMAPGGTSGMQLYSTVDSGFQGPVSGTYGYKQGTSFSAPLAAGVASLMISVNPSLTPAQIVDRLKASARPHATGTGYSPCGSGNAGSCECTALTCGSGLLDAYQAVRQALNPAARIATPGSVSPGSVLLLDGRESAAATGASLEGFLWTQVGGPALTIRSSNLSVASVTLPATAAAFEFRLQVTDDQARTGEQTLAVDTATVPAPGGGGGGGATSWGWSAGLGLMVLAAVVWRRVRLARSAA